MEDNDVKTVWLWDISKDFKELFDTVPEDQQEQNQSYFVNKDKGEIDFFIHEDTMSRMDIMGKIGEYLATRHFKMCSITVELPKDGWTPVYLRHHNDYKRVKY